MGEQNTDSWMNWKKEEETKKKKNWNIYRYFLAACNVMAGACYFAFVCFFANIHNTNFRLCIFVFSFLLEKPNEKRTAHAPPRSISAKIKSKHTHNFFSFPIKSNQIYIKTKQINKFKQQQQNKRKNNKRKLNNEKTKMMRRYTKLQIAWVMLIRVAFESAF